MNYSSPQYRKGVPLMEQTRAMRPHLEHVRRCTAAKLIDAISDGNVRDFTNTNGVDLTLQRNGLGVCYNEKPGTQFRNMTALDGATLSVIDVSKPIVPGVMGCSVSLENGDTNTGGQISASRLRELCDQLSG